jgi:hypothetical protein
MFTLMALPAAGPSVDDESIPVNIEQYTRPFGVYSKAQRIGLELLAKADITPQGWHLDAVIPDSTAPAILNFADQREFCSTPGPAHVTHSRSLVRPSHAFISGRCSIISSRLLVKNFRRCRWLRCRPFWSRRTPSIKKCRPRFGTALEAATRGGYSRFGKKIRRGGGCRQLADPIPR